MAEISWAAGFPPEWYRTSAAQFTHDLARFLSEAALNIYCMSSAILEITDHPLTDFVIRLFADESNPRLKTIGIDCVDVAVAMRNGSHYIATLKKTNYSIAADAIAVMTRRGWLVKQEGALWVATDKLNRRLDVLLKADELLIEDTAGAKEFFEEYRIKLQ